MDLKDSQNVACAGRTLTINNARDGMIIRNIVSGTDRILMEEGDGFRLNGEKVPFSDKWFYMWRIVAHPPTPAQPSGSLAVEAALPTILEGFRVLVDEGVDNMLSLMARLDQKGCSPVEWILATAVNNRLQKMQEILGDSGEANHGE